MNWAILEGRDLFGFLTPDGDHDACRLKSLAASMNDVIRITPCILQAP